jgi:hypothetical protein
VRYEGLLCGGKYGNMKYRSVPKAAIRSKAKLIPKYTAKSEYSIIFSLTDTHVPIKSQSFSYD